MVAIGLARPSVIGEILKSTGKAIMLLLPMLPFFATLGSSELTLLLPIPMLWGFCAYLPAAGWWIFFPKSCPDLIKCYCSIFLIITLWFWFFQMFRGQLGQWL